MKFYLFSLCTFFIFVSFQSEARDLTPDYKNLYYASKRLNEHDINYLKNIDIILIPGILSEIFTWEDPRGKVDFSVLTKEYFGAQVKHLRFTLKIPVQKLRASSKKVAETSEEIAIALRKSRIAGRKALIVAHSLGGLALTDYLLNSPEVDHDVIQGVMLWQVPFYGSPIADVYLHNPYYSSIWLMPFLPFVNTSMETITYLSVAERTKFMGQNFDKVKSLYSRIPTISMSGISNGTASLFVPGANLNQYGCLVNLKKICITRNLYKGKLDLSDGLVPLYSSRLPGMDNILLEGVDHGEAIVNLPFQNLSKEIMTESMLKLLIEKMTLAD